MGPWLSEEAVKSKIVENDLCVTMATEAMSSISNQPESKQFRKRNGTTKTDKQNNIVQDSTSIKHPNGDSKMASHETYGVVDQVDGPVQIRLEKGTSSSGSTPSKSSSSSRSSAPVEIPATRPPITETVHLSLPGNSRHTVHPPAGHKRAHSFQSNRPKYESYKSIPEITAEARLVLEQYLKQRSLSHGDLSPPSRGVRQNDLSVIEEHKTGASLAVPDTSVRLGDSHSDSGAGDVSRNRRPSYATATENLFFPPAQPRAVSEGRHTPDSLDWDPHDNGYFGHSRRDSFSSDKESSDGDAEHRAKHKKNVFKRAQQRLRESFRRNKKLSGIRTPDSEHGRSITPSVTTTASGDQLDDNLLSTQGSDVFNNERRFVLVSAPSNEVSPEKSFFMSIWNKLKGPTRKTSWKKRRTSSKKSSSSHSDVDTPSKQISPTEIFSDALDHRSRVPSDASSVGRPATLSRPVSRSGSNRSTSSLHRHSVSKQHSFKGRCSYAHSHSHPQRPDRSSLSLPGLISHGQTGGGLDQSTSNKEARRRALKKQLEENAQSDGPSQSTTAKAKTPDGIDGDYTDSGSSPDEKPAADHDQSPSERGEMYARVAEKLDNIADSLTRRSPAAEQGLAIGGHAEGRNEPSSLERKIAELLRHKGDTIHESRIPKDAIVQIVKHHSYKKFKKIVKSQIHGEAGMDQIALLFEVTRIAIDLAGHGGALAYKIKEMSLKFFEDKFASWVIGQGGWDSVIESDEERDMYGHDDDDDDDQGDMGTRV